MWELFYRQYHMVGKQLAKNQNYALKMKIL